jgi:UDP-N-acetylmuramate dehydrogenase
MRSPAPTGPLALAPLTTLGVGGAARFACTARDAAEVAAALAWAEARGLATLVLGGGSNLVIADEGWPGLVLQPALRGVRFDDQGATTLVRAAAGEPWDALVAECVARELAGIECLSGIPGGVGGTPIQNVGAYGQEVAGTIEAVLVLDRGSGATRALAGADCGFGYRSSRFKGADAGRFVVLEVAFRLARGGAPTLAYPELAARLGAGATLAEVRAAVLALRRAKGMVLDAADPDARSCGSFFMNPVLAADDHARLRDEAGRPAPGFATDAGLMKVPAAWLIERAGFAKGTARGAVGLSTKHPLALVNRGGATAAEVVRFAREVQRAVAERFAVTLRTEPEFVGFDAPHPLAGEVAALRGTA